MRLDITIYLKNTSFLQLVNKLDFCERLCPFQGLDENSATFNTVISKLNIECASQLFFYEVPENSIRRNHARAKTPCIWLEDGTVLKTIGLHDYFIQLLINY